MSEARKLIDGWLGMWVFKRSTAVDNLENRITDALTFAERRGIVKGMRDASEIANGEILIDIDEWMKTKKEFSGDVANEIAKNIRAAAEKIEKEMG